MGTANDNNDRKIAEHFAKACDEARTHLWKQMEEAGLHARDGWRISETIRTVEEGSELVMRPLHLYLTAPDWLECVVAIDEQTTQIDSNCVP